MKNHVQISMILMMKCKTQCSCDNSLKMKKTKDNIGLKSNLNVIIITYLTGVLAFLRLYFVWSGLVSHIVCKL